MTTNSRDNIDWLDPLSVHGNREQCKWVNLAYERHSRDLEDGHARGLWFDSEAGWHAVNWIETYCKHIKGPLAQKPVALEPWQVWIVLCVFGWMKLPKGMMAKQAEAIPFGRRKSAGIKRRFNFIYQELARKNGKSLLLSAIGLYLLIADGEGGPEIYSAATKREQAREIWDVAKAMIAADEDLREVCKVSKAVFNISVAHPINGKFEPLGRDADTMDGKNPSAALIDEYHAHKDSSILDVLRSGQAVREQPITWVITTAGFNRMSACFSERAYSLQVLDGAIDNDEHFAIIYTLDDEDVSGLFESEDLGESVWHKANPNLDVAVPREELTGKIKKARDMPRDRNEVLTKRLNVWTDTHTLWLPSEEWDKCTDPVDVDPVKWRNWAMDHYTDVPCWGGLDLGSTNDLTAFALFFEDGAILPWFWVPESCVRRREEENRYTYRDWIDAGFMTQTTGLPTTDYDQVRSDIVEICERFNFVDAGVDTAFQGYQLVVELTSGHGLKFYKFGQGWLHMTAPCRRLEELVLNNEIDHGNNPVLKWMARNVVVESKGNGDMKPDKVSSQEKIDGIVAMLMAIGRRMAHEAEQASIYETQGLRGI